MVELPQEKVSFDVELSKEAPHIDFRDLGGFKGEKIDFPDIKYFGFDHGNNTQQMAWVLMSYEDLDEEGKKLPVDKCVVDTSYNRRVMWMAAFFHDIGRTKPWNEKDPEAPARSRAMTRAIFDVYLDLKVEKDGEFMRDVLDLIENYPTGDGPLHKCLREANRFEEARIEPNTKAGLMNVSEAWKDVETAFGESKGFQQQYMRSKGWVF